MRETIFRAKTFSGRTIEGCLVYSENISPAIYFEIGTGKVKTMEYAYIQPDTLEQFTGFYDKKKKRIFEGDKLKETFYLKESAKDSEDDILTGHYTVFFHEEHKAFCIDETKSGSKRIFSYLSELDLRYFDII